MDVVYFSNVSENTKRFVEKLGTPAQRIPVRSGDPALSVSEPYLLIVPTYGGGHGEAAVPKQVITFLNDPSNRALIRGVVATGNTNFGSTYCLAGEIIADKCMVPLYYRLELLGTDDDKLAVQYILASLEEMEHYDTRG